MTSDHQTQSSAELLLDREMEQYHSRLIRPSMNPAVSPRWWGYYSICRCLWPNCQYSSVYRGNVKKHIRMVHFQLPATLREQREQNIIDTRDPRQYLAVDFAPPRCS